MAAVARQLGVCTATVYKLCARGELPHTRNLSVIRIAQGDLGCLRRTKAMVSNVGGELDLLLGCAPADTEPLFGDIGLGKLTDGTAPVP